MVRDAIIRLRDGRALAFAEWGDPLGVPVFYFHGSPGSRLFIPDEDATNAAGVRLIAPARPGGPGSAWPPGGRSRSRAAG